MNKKLSFLLLISLFTIGFSSCDAKPKHKLTFVNQIFGDLVKTNAKDGMFEEGYEFTCKMPIVTDVGNYVFMNDEAISYYSSDDVLGGYEIYKVNMPSKDSTLVITHNRFYRDIDYKIITFFTWINYLDINNINSVTYENGYIGVAPEHEISSIKTSENKDDISKVVDFLKNATARKADPMLVGGSYVKIILKMNDESTQELRINNGCVCWSDFSFSQQFKLNENLPSIFS